MQRDVVLAVDGNSLVHRSFHALAGTGMRGPDGSPIWAVRGLLTQLVAAADRLCPAEIVVGFDDAAESLRRRRWPQYKANRTEKLDSLVRQLELAVDILTEIGVHVVVPPALEADDVLASVARLAAATGRQAVVMTSDRDSFALIDENTSVLRIINGGVEASPLLTPDRLELMLGIRPHQYRDFAALRGDPSDNLPGVRGIGPKTAARLLQEFGSASAAFAESRAGDRLRTAVGAAVAARLSEPEAEECWRLNCAVMSLHDDVDLALDGGRAALPLSADLVEKVFRAHQLPSTLPAALRALCHQDVEAPEPVFARASYASEPGFLGYGRPARYARLHPAPAKPKTDQLSLF